MINPQHEISIEFCAPCNYAPRAVGLTDELLTKWAPLIIGAAADPERGRAF